ncbi:short-chain dehydrogenase [Massilia eurypsychrophila]|uniref:Short-chain dehydrogenase n=1 Tax=Massilia eurypsychrophila TaxID=1485217 RepID=A0A2G8T8B1_9BURK|nr:short-chain dehydrogenase [Massilia eurypsychrophila]
MGQAALAAVAELSPAPQAAILGRKERVDIANAAMINGISSHTFDFDDTHLKTIIHPAGPVASAVLALGEHIGATGREMIDALVIGIEVSCRVGNAIYPDHYEVTGAGRNIGREIALRLARQGVAVAVNVRQSVAEGQAVVDDIKRQGGAAILCMADVTDREAVENMVSTIDAAWGRLDILINNAAIRKEVEFSELSVAQWHATLGVVLDGTFHCSQAALALRKKSGQGTIVNIGGLTAHTGAEHRVHVITAKAGLVGMTKALANDLGADGITVNCVAPGMIDTQRATSSSSGTPGHHATRHTLLGRNGTPAEVADAVLWLVGDGARFITGQVSHVNGGAYLGS